MNWKRLIKSNNLIYRVDRYKSEGIDTNEIYEYEEQLESTPRRALDILKNLDIMKDNNLLIETQKLKLMLFTGAYIKIWRFCRTPSRK